MFFILKTEKLESKYVIVIICIVHSELNSLVSLFLTRGGREEERCQFHSNYPIISCFHFCIFWSLGSHVAACRLCVCRSEPVSVSVSSCLSLPPSAWPYQDSPTCPVFCLSSSLHFHFSPCSHPHSRSSRYVRNRIQSFIQQVMSLLPLILIRPSTPIFADFKFPFPSALFPMQPI